MGPSLSALPVFATLLLGFTSTSQAFDQLDYCDGTCPRFKLQSKNKKYNYEERVYEESVWICTRMQDKSLDEAKAAFYRLNNCVSGNTWPVLLREKGEEYSMCWFKAPEVTTVCEARDGLTDYTMPKTTMFVRFFDQHQSIEEGEENARNLIRDLGLAKEKAKEGVFYGAAYSSYFSLWPHNEIWVPQDKS